MSGLCFIVVSHMTVSRAHNLQVWMIVHTLIMHPTCRQKCRLESAALRSQLAVLRTQIRDDVAEQLPFLKGIAFLLDQLACETSDPYSKDVKTPGFGIIEQVCPYT